MFTGHGRTDEARRRILAQAPGRPAYAWTPTAGARRSSPTRNTRRTDRDWRERERNGAGTRNPSRFAAEANAASRHRRARTSVANHRPASRTLLVDPCSVNASAVLTLHIMATTRRWREKAIQLDHITLVTFEGPGSEWICVVRGHRVREATPPKKRPRSSQPRRREGRA